MYKSRAQPALPAASEAALDIPASRMVGAPLVARGAGRQRRRGSLLGHWAMQQALAREATPSFC